MICYRDITFCTFYETCKEPCYRALTPDVIAAAELWWGSEDVPIATFMEKPECYKP